MKVVPLRRFPTFGPIIKRLSPPKKESGRWGFRPLVGIGVMEVQTFEALGGGLEHTNRVPASFGSVDRPEGSIGPGTKVPRACFAAFSLQATPPLAD